MNIHIHRGASAYSEFRLSKLTSLIRTDLPDLTGLNARYVHFIESNVPLNEDDLDKLNQLLDYGPNHTDFENAIKFWSIPRLGTISPWSTKASDIVLHCGLETITRVERGVEWQINFNSQRSLGAEEKVLFAQRLADRMTESLLFNLDEVDRLFEHASPAALNFVDVLDSGREALNIANKKMGLALSDDETEYLYNACLKANRNITDVELMMFSQVNSEHCRHKIFNASWTIDQQDEQNSLFDMIRNTHRINPQGTLIAYKDNAAVIEGSKASRFFPDAKTQIYGYQPEAVNILVKVETHNHPTAISPFPGAATGSGGEIRDEGATGRGGKPKAGVTGFSVSNLRLPGNLQAWEGDVQKPSHIASPLSIMLEGPIGGASFNNEFGRPNIAGYFRTFEQPVNQHSATRFGYHKPIMIAGGMGNIRPQHVNKNPIKDADKIIVLGGPAMLIGLGGGAASSVASGHSDEDLDFASVQRGNPEMQRRCQEVIDRCWEMGDDNPIVSIHDVGAGGLSNAVPELVHDAGLGGDFELRRVLNDEMSMSPMEIWCNESQERYVIAVKAQRLLEFETICERERCLYCVIGHATDEQELKLSDDLLNHRQGDPIDLSMDVLFANPPQMHRDVISFPAQITKLRLDEVEINEAITRLLNLPAIADKTFLVTIGDRSVTGMISRDQMVGPWQVPVADVAVTTSSFDSYFGEAMAMGERTPVAVLNPAASGKMAVGEVITNIAAASIESIRNIKLSANWMAAAGFQGQDAALYETVKAVGIELCPELGIAIPVGKDSMSMRTVWKQIEPDQDQDKDQDQQLTVASPVSLIVTGFAPVTDVRKTLTPVLKNLQDDQLFLIDLGEGLNRLGGSCLAQVYNVSGEMTPDVNDASLVKHFFELIQHLNQENLIHAYHDRSDGGLFVTLVEMAFASRCGLDIVLDGFEADARELLFNEELGAVIQIKNENAAQFKKLLKHYNLQHCTHFIGHRCETDRVSIRYHNDQIINSKRSDLHRQWSQTTWQMQSLRDNPECARQEYDRILDHADSGLYSNLNFDVKEDIAAPYLHKSIKPKIAILREQGVNSQTEMAAAFDRAGFTSVDVHMSDLIESRQFLNNFSGLVACGGFSFGDVLGAGQGWAKSILFNNQLKDEFSEFFQQPDKFSLGVCNGCQMMSAIKSLIPGAQHWPEFTRNLSEQYEARQVMVKIEQTPSIFFTQMAGSEFPVVVAHGEGKAIFSSDEAFAAAESSSLIAARFIDNQGLVTQKYPFNPNGSPAGITALTSIDGRSTILMPHPERVFRSVTNSWRSEDWGEDSPWMRIFRNARCWVN